MQEVFQNLVYIAASHSLLQAHRNYSQAAIQDFCKVGLFLCLGKSKKVLGV